MTAEEAGLLLLGALYLLFAIMDLYVARRLVRAAAIRPSIDALNAAAIIAVAITVGAAIGAFLGLAGIYRATTGTALLPAPLSLSLLALALGVPSAANVYLLRLLRRWDVDRRNAHLHSRNSERAVRYHRRKDDPQP